MTSQKSPRSTEVVRSTVIVLRGTVRRLSGKSWRIDFVLFFCFVFLLCDVQSATQPLLVSSRNAPPH